MDADLFRELVTTPGISGREERIREVVAKRMTGLVDETRIDALGNLVGIRRGSGKGDGGGRGPKVMFCAHMDSIGFLVTHIDEAGFLRISPVGGFDPRTLVMQRVVVCGREQDYCFALSGR